MKAVGYIDRIGGGYVGDIRQDGLETVPRTMQNTIWKGFHLNTPAALLLDKLSVWFRDRIDQG